MLFIRSQGRCCARRRGKCILPAVPHLSKLWRPLFSRLPHKPLQYKTRHWSQRQQKRTLRRLLFISPFRFFALAQQSQPQPPAHHHRSRRATKERNVWCGLLYFGAALGTHREHGQMYPVPTVMVQLVVVVKACLVRCISSNQRSSSPPTRPPPLLFPSKSFSGKAHAMSPPKHRFPHPDLIPLLPTTILPSTDSQAAGPAPPPALTTAEEWRPFPHQRRRNGPCSESTGRSTAKSKGRAWRT